MAWTGQHNFVVQQQQQQPPRTAFVVQQGPSAAQQQSQQQQRFRANEAQLQLFYRGLDAVLQQWTALILICRNDQQNPGQRDQTNALALRDELRSWFAEEGELYSDELEDYFAEFFDAAHGASIEDGSLKEVADVLSEMYRRCCGNDDELVVRFEHSLVVFQSSGTINQCNINFGSDDDNDDDDDDNGNRDGADYDDDDDDDYDGADDDGYDDDGYYDDEYTEGALLDQDGGGMRSQQQQQQQLSKAKKKGGGGGGGGGWKTTGSKKK
jgi:pre-rRNA-processing protein TSR2